MDVLPIEGSGVDCTFDTGPMFSCQLLALRGMRAAAAAACGSVGAVEGYHRLLQAISHGALCPTTNALQLERDCAICHLKKNLEYS